MSKNTGLAKVGLQLVYGKRPAGYDHDNGFINCVLRTLNCKPTFASLCMLGENEERRMEAEGEREEKMK